LTTIPLDGGICIIKRCKSLVKYSQSHTKQMIYIYTYMCKMFLICWTFIQLKVSGHMVWIRTDNIPVGSKWHMAFFYLELVSWRWWTYVYGIRRILVIIFVARISRWILVIIFVTSNSRNYFRKYVYHG
jgi:hypothetical protein